ARLYTHTMDTKQLHIYRQLLREVNRQFTSTNGNRFWAAQLRLKWLAEGRSSPVDSNSMRTAQNVLSYLSNNRKYKDLIAEFNPKMTEGDRIERTARRVGLEAPKAYEEQ
ncbi:hypothetical protein GQ54DRAFT_263706, partial [Martensiomyces pterosporus]